MSRYNSPDDQAAHQMIIDLHKRLSTLESQSGIGSPTNLTSTPFSITDSFNQTSYTDLTGVSTTFTKKFTSSKLLIRISGSGFCTATLGVDIGVAISGTDYDVVHFFFNTASQHSTFLGELEIPTSLAAGDIAIQGRIKVSTSTINFDGNDRIFLTATETASP